MKWLRNMLVPHCVYYVIVSTKDLQVEERIFMDEETKTCWVKLMCENGEYKVLLDKPVKML